MPWTISEGPIDAGWSGRDAVGWRWVLTNDRDQRGVVTVWVSGTAMAIAPEYLPSDTVRARDSRGQSEIERLLGEQVLPREVMMHTAGRSVDPGEAGCWVELRGPGEALEKLARLFAHGAITVTRRGAEYYLRADAFTEIADDTELRVRAAGLLREAVGAAWIDGEAVEGVEVASVRRVE
jgi:hypothetical protein